MTFSIPHPECSLVHSRSWYTDMVGAQKQQRLWVFGIGGFIPHPLRLLQFLSCHHLSQILPSSWGFLAPQGGGLIPGDICYRPPGRVPSLTNGRPCFSRTSWGTHTLVLLCVVCPLLSTLASQALRVQIRLHRRCAYSLFCRSVYCRLFQCVGDSANISPLFRKVSLHRWMRSNTWSFIYQPWSS